jgi:hypothetical protein
VDAVLTPGNPGYAPVRQNAAAVAQYPPLRSHSLR